MTEQPVTLRKRIGKRARTILVVLAAGVVTFSLVTTTITVSQHNSELQKITSLTQRLGNDERTIAGFARGFSSTQTTDHDLSTSKLDAICAALDITAECTAPSP